MIKTHPSSQSYLTIVNFLYYDGIHLSHNMMQVFCVGELKNKESKWDGGSIANTTIAKSSRPSSIHEGKHEI